MKLLFVLMITMASQITLAQSKALDGRTYCRTINVTLKMFGQPTGLREHCIAFNDGIAVDDGSTFFGNPPEFSEYEVNGNQVLFKDSELSLSEDKKTLTLVNKSVVLVFNLK